MCGGGLRALEPREHTAELGDPVGVVEDAQAGGGDAPVVGLLHHDVAVGERGDLGKVRDDDDLAGARQASQTTADLDRRLAPDACKTSSGTSTVRAQYDTFERWNGNQRGSSIISTGISGTLPHSKMP